MFITRKGGVTCQHIINITVLRNYAEMPLICFFPCFFLYTINCERLPRSSSKFCQRSMMAMKRYLLLFSRIQNFVRGGGACLSNIEIPNEWWLYVGIYATTPFRSISYHADFFYYQYFNISCCARG